MDKANLVRQKISLVVFGLLLGVVICETSLRAAGYAVVSFIEAQNRRAIAKKGTCRVLCLGESTTQGQWPRYLRECLKHRCPDKEFSIIDKGLSGTTTSVIMSWIGPELERLHPDIVIAMIGINDPASPVKPFAGFIGSLRIVKLVRFIPLSLAVQAERSATQVQGCRLPLEKSDAEYLRLGWSYRDHEDYSLALQAFRKATELNPANDAAFAGLGWVYRIQGDFAAAGLALEKAIAINPRNQTAYLNLGWLYQAEGKLALAQEALTQAVKIDPRSAVACIALGNFYLAQGKLPEAGEAFKNALAAEPGNRDAGFQLARLYALQHKYTETETLFGQVIKTNPTDPLVYLELANSYWQQGNAAAAEEALKKAVRLYPADSRGYAALALIYEEKGEEALARVYRLQAEVIQDRLRPVTVQNYLRLKGMLDRKGIRLVCVQYPMRSIKPLKRIFGGNSQGIIFVDNQATFRRAVSREGYFAYFLDMFAGDFGHCTEKGNRLLAGNIATALLDGK